MRTLGRPQVFAVLGLACALAACDDSREPLPDWSAGYPDAGSDAGDAGVASGFGLVLPDSVTWPARLHLADAGDQPCTYKASDRPHPVDCVLDVNELDLWVLGLKYDVVMPAGTCDMLLHLPYLFANFPYGVGPNRVAYTIDADGGVQGSEVNSVGGKPVCAFDHSRVHQDMPNCCFGLFAREVTSAADGGVTRTVESWGGTPGDCFYGAGYLEKDVTFGASGLPLPRIIYVDRAAHRFSVEYDGLSDKYPANVPLANYFAPSEHGGTEPAALKPWIVSASLSPAFYEPPMPGYEPPWPYADAPPRPYYEAFCLDDAEEIQAHIRLTVREWNEEAQFNAAGDPDTGRNREREPGWDAGPVLLDDIADWGTLTPGNTTFPKLMIAKESD
ncbi:MAG: hypothetical protein ABW252_22200 [Polyangiales bacterium]